MPHQVARLSKMMWPHHFAYISKMVALSLIVTSLTACATVPTPEPKIVTKTVSVPVPVPCTVALPPEPVYADTPEALHAAPDILSAVKLLLIGRLQRMNVIDEQKAALSGCSK